MSLPLPSIPGYQVERVLGAGGMAAVYLAVHERLKRKVAIKIMANTLSLDEKFRQRFLNEAQVCAQLHHPNIINVYDSGEVDGALFMVTEFMDGGTLKERIGGLSPGDALAITEKLAEALEEAHDSRVWHRDIKPDNVLFDRRGRFVLADFGIAKAEGTEGHSLTGTGNIVGTPHFMSPEQFQALPVDGRSDIYSLGIMFYQMLTGHLPFDAPDMFALAMKHVKEAPPALPPEFAAYQPLVDRMLAKNADQRFQSCTELRSAIRALAAERGSSAVGRAPELPTKPSAVAPIARPAAATPEPPARAANRGPVLALGAVAVAAAIGIGLWLMRDDVAPQPTQAVSSTASEPGPVPAKPEPAGGTAETPPPVAPASTQTQTQPEAKPATPVETPPAPARITTPRARTAVDAAALAALDDAALEARLGNALRAGDWPQWESSLAALAGHTQRHPVARHRVLFQRLQDAGASFDGGPLDAGTRVAVLRSLDRDAARQLAAGRKGRTDAGPGESAVDLYRAMLALDTANGAAEAGIERVASDYVNAAKVALGKNNVTAARGRYDRALEVDPENETVRAARAALGN